MSALFVFLVILTVFGKHALTKEGDLQRQPPPSPRAPNAPPKIRRAGFPYPARFISETPPKYLRRPQAAFLNAFAPCPRHRHVGGRLSVCDEISTSSDIGPLTASPHINKNGEPRKVRQHHPPKHPRVGASQARTLTNPRHPFNRLATRPPIARKQYQSWHAPPHLPFPPVLIPRRPDRLREGSPAATPWNPNLRSHPNNASLLLIVFRKDQCESASSP